MAIAHTVCSLDDFPADTELRALEAYRSMLLEALPQPAASSPQEQAEAEEAPLPPPRPLAELMAELDALVGLKPRSRPR